MTTLGVVCSMTNVFAAEQVCFLGNITGDTPEAVMAQVKPFYTKYDDVKNEVVYRTVSISENYTFIGLDETLSDKESYVYDVKVKKEACVHSETYVDPPPKPPYIFEICIPNEYLIYLECKPATCPAPTNGQRAAADCTQTVSLTPAPGQTEPRPKGSEGDGKSTYDLIAKVTEGNQPKAGMALTFTVEVEAGSGGIPTTPTGRPTGNLSVKSGTTNASGEVKVTFTSPVFAGTHTVTVTCAKCTGTKKDDTEIFNVKVPNLISLPADNRWEFISTDNYHKNNNTSVATRTVYYVTEQAKTNLGQMVDAIQTTPLDTAGTRFWGKIGLNDASLKWGGKFNAYVKVNGVYPPYPWNRQGQHGEHRLGVQIDLQTLKKTKADSFVMYDRVCKPKPDQYKVVPTILFHTGGSYHFHAYLLGNIAVNLGGGKCKTMNN
ncbi:MAG: hypothetical protein RI956_350 [Pseudomonadota bacterium]|jgi:hypothetical protein